MHEAAVESPHAATMEWAAASSRQAEWIRATGKVVRLAPSRRQYDERLLPHAKSDSRGGVGGAPHVPSAKQSEMDRDARVSDEPSPAIGGNRGRGHPMCVSSTRRASALPGGDGSRLGRGGATQAKGRPKTSDAPQARLRLGTAGTDLPIGKCWERRVIPWTDSPGPSLGSQSSAFATKAGRGRSACCDVTTAMAEGNQELA